MHHSLSLSSEIARNLFSIVLFMTVSVIYIRDLFQIQNHEEAFAIADVKAAVLQNILKIHKLHFFRNISSNIYNSC